MVELLIRQAGLCGARCGKLVRTTVPNAKAAYPLDRVNRQFRAKRPNQLWVADFTYVSTRQGFVYVAFVIDVFTRCIVGRRVSSSMHTDFVLDALEQALNARRPGRKGALVHHSDRGSPSTSRSATASTWPGPASIRRWVAPATPTTTRWPKPSMGCTRPRSCTGAGRGRRSRLWSWPRWSGCGVQQTGAAGAHRLHPAG